MYYAKLDQAGESLTARFYTRHERDEFCSDRRAVPVRSRAAKFVPGASGCITFSGRSADGTWLPL